MKPTNMERNEPNMAARYEHEIPEGYEARIEGNKVIIELKESEDERIRRGLIKLLTVASEAYLVESTGIKKDSYLAYLEKQKGPLTPEEKMNHPLYLEGFDVGKKVGKVLTEQKPAEWNEAFVERLMDCMCAAQQYRIGTISWDVVEGWAEELNELKKPVAWGEEDDIGWDEAFACVTRAEKAAKNEEELQNAVTAEKWLKEIKFKYCVHPVKQEWSEENEAVLDALIRRLEGEDIYVSPHLAAECLKSLRRRPKSSGNWKPSEEQMKALSRCILIGNEDMIYALNSLCNDLKKLI